MENAGSNGQLDWGVAARAIAGEMLSGDKHLVVPTTRGWLLAVVDGLGHGRTAAVAGESFMEVLQQNVEKSPVELIKLAHEALRLTRGSAATIASIDRAHGLLSWAGVGNVEGVIRRDHPSAAAMVYVTMLGGIIGQRIPKLKPSFVPLHDGDVLVLATDGIGSNFVQAIGVSRPPAKLAQDLLEHYAKPTDDALVLVARWHLPTAHQGENQP